MTNAILNNVRSYCNCIKHESTGFSPYMLMFGREPKLAVDIAFGLHDKTEDKRSYSDYISDLQNRIREAFEKTHKEAEKAREKTENIL